MRTVTNYFIVNLAVADFLVILICLPPTVLWDVTDTWFMGTLACKIVLYLQVSVFFSSLLYSIFYFNKRNLTVLELKRKSGKQCLIQMLVFFLELCFVVQQTSNDNGYLNDILENKLFFFENQNLTIEN